MPLPYKDQKDILKGIYEVIDALGTTIEYLPLDESSPVNLYKERKGVKYLDPVTLLCTTEVKVEDTNLESIQKPNRLLTVTIPAYDLILKNIDPYDVVKGLFVFENKKYSITSCTPTGLLAGVFPTYEFLCGGVDII